ncbi:MAG: IcmW protein [uncultured bacterium]|nr:MAG: IcmW protein [uncultured bacterium]OGT26660.1 MAG: phosphoesterase [Gammaproteobacteria bacterium RIFCSPHIGHO2_02_FULL_42_43]OGT27737.1 MAG: phosphoesterase [Gammaproteobacteria bacterium RIFCSPHIGHO2_01_FULL_42_8]OGT53034.1 MAG: phosphoesterase [Gammaproteobacteria bacterium RIFCSPHIGHO2_12_FULL_41_25]OGT61193.1 MAG: phosphoesterase [Gammaproteobacteria bacterium RIFCSPLOWO2_02_FULL_42_14]OGT87120.1 MAG: phosphoesterase [Gammaproteobacteria bacterium RIFCSPLOWO2_12_FULL_42_18]
MPDLSSKASHEFWGGFQDPMIYRVISFMESVEDWTLDGDAELEKSMKELGDTLEDIGSIDLAQENNMVDMLAYIKTGRGLRLLMCLDTAYPGAAAKVLMKAEEITKSQKDNAGFFLRRNVVFERLRLLGRVFSQDRLKLVQQALEDAGDVSI